MKSKLFLASLAAAVAIPSAVASVPAFAETPGNTKSVTDFTDVPKNFWAYKDIMAMRDAGIIFGYGDNTFKPQQSISRVHTAMMFDRALPLEPLRAGKEFTDVPKSHQHYDIVQKVYRAGIFDGNTDGSFGINDNLTRAAMAKVMVVAFDLEIHKGFIFDDVGESHWAADYISSLYVSGITVGGGDGKFSPNGSVSRAQYSAFLYRALNPDDAPVPEKPLEPYPPKPEVKPDPEPEVKPDPKPEPPKPEVKPDPKPPTSPTPPVTNPVPGNPFPPTVKPPAGWTDKSKEHFETAKETVFKYSPKLGSGTGFGVVNYALNRFDDPVVMEYVAGNLKNAKSSITPQQWVDAAKQVIKTGELYIAPDYSFSLYVVYVSDTAIIKWTF